MLQGTVLPLDYIKFSRCGMNPLERIKIFILQLGKTLGKMSSWEVLSEGQCVSIAGISTVFPSFIGYFLDITHDFQRYECKLHILLALSLCCYT